MFAEQDQLLAHLLRDKEYDRVEVEMQLFENCNMRCSFCSQDHRASLEQDILPSLLRKVALAGEYVRLHPSKEFRFNLMGGELFQDRFEDALFENLYAVVGALKDICDERGKEPLFTFTSNLIFERHERVEALLRRLRSDFGSVRLATSFDFVGRPWTPGQKALFQRNTERFSEWIEIVGVVLHRLSIRKMLEGGDPLFDWLYERLPIMFEYYIPDLNRQDLFSPTDQENLEAWRFLARNYPKVEPIQRWLNNDHNEVKCCSVNRLTILADGSISSCRYMPYKPVDFRTDLDRHSIAGMALRFIDEQQCLMCDHFKRCGLHCFVQADRSARERREGCFVREFFEEFLNIGKPDGSHRQAHPGL